jgi:hypothetical protein
MFVLLGEKAHSAVRVLFLPFLDRVICSELVSTLRLGSAPGRLCKDRLEEEWRGSLLLAREGGCDVPKIPLTLKLLLTLPLLFLLLLKLLLLVLPAYALPPTISLGSLNGSISAGRIFVADAPR